MNLAYDDAQIRDTGYASNYDLRIAGSVAPASDLKSAIERLLGPVTIDLSLKAQSEPLSSSPKGVLTGDTARVQLGKPVTLKIDLDPASINYFLIGPNVDGLIISRWKDDALTQIATIPLSASGQTHFEYKWTPSRDFLGMNDLVAFVQTLGLPAVPLEIAPGLHHEGRGRRGLRPAANPDARPASTDLTLVLRRAPTAANARAIA